MSRRRSAALLTAALLAAPLVAGCAAGRNADTINTAEVTDAASADVGPLQVRNAYVAPPETGVYGKGGDAPLYVTVANRGSADTLTAVTSPDASSVVVAAADPTGGSSQPASGTGLPLALPGGTALPLGPTSTHLLLQGLGRRLVSGQSVKVTLVFAAAGSTTLTVPVGLAEDAASGS